jgi:hypothetical protein
MKTIKTVGQLQKLLEELPKSYELRVSIAGSVYSFPEGISVHEEEKFISIDGGPAEILDPVTLECVGMSNKFKAKKGK